MRHEEGGRFIWALIGAIFRLLACLPALLEIGAIENDAAVGHTWHLVFHRIIPRQSFSPGLLAVEIGVNCMLYAVMAALLKFSWTTIRHRLQT